MALISIAVLLAGVGLMLVVMIAAVLCLGYAWLHRNPVMPLDDDRGDIASMLWRTSPDFRFTMTSVSVRSGPYRATVINASSPRTSSI